MQTKIPVIVTAVGGGGFGEQILKALRLARTPYEIIATDMDPNSAGFADADRAYTVPPAGSAGYIDTLLQIAQKHAARVVFPGSEPELVLISDHRDLLDEAGIFVPISPDAVIRDCTDKARTFEVLERHGFAVPAWRRVTSLSDLDGFGPLPAVLKPTLGGGGSANVFLAQQRAHLHCFGSYLLDVLGQFIVQEYVGTPENEYTVGVLLDMEGHVINSIALRRHLVGSLSTRLRVANVSGRADLGERLVISSGVSQGEIDRFPDVSAFAERVALALGCQGAVNVQCRVVADRPMIFEINPRFSGTTSVRAMFGYNEPDVLVRKHVLREDIHDHFTYNSGRVVRSLSERLV